MRLEDGTIRDSCVFANPTLNSIKKISESTQSITNQTYNTIVKKISGELEHELEQQKSHGGDVLFNHELYEGPVPSFALTKLSPKVSPKFGLGAGPPSFAEFAELRRANATEVPSTGNKAAKAGKDGMMFGDQIQEGEDEPESTAPQHGPFACITLAKLSANYKDGSDAGSDGEYDRTYSTRPRMRPKAVAFIDSNFSFRRKNKNQLKSSSIKAPAARDDEPNSRMMELLTDRCIEQKPQELMQEAHKKATRKVLCMEHVDRSVQDIMDQASMKFSMTSIPSPAKTTRGSAPANPFLSSTKGFKKSINPFPPRATFRDLSPAKRSQFLYSKSPTRKNTILVATEQEKKQRLLEIEREFRTTDYKTLNIE